MFRNYLKIAYRNIFRNPVYSFINIFGLSVGIACSILIMLWVYDEISYDHFQPKLSKLHQVWINATYDGKINSYTSVPLPTYEELKTTDNSIKSTVVTDWGSEHLLTVGETRLLKNGFYASEEFLEMFQFPLITGSADKVLDDPTSIVISQSAAKSLFGDKDPVNQVIRVDNDTDLKVSGVLKDVPENSSFQFDVLLPFKYYEKQPWVKRSKTQWGNYSFPVYVELQSAESITTANAAIKDVLTKKGEVDIKREFFLHPMSHWRLYSNFENGKEAGGQVDYVKMFSIIAIFILVIACINFMNLATARSERRAREVGIRKSVGSRRKELIGQFLGESVLIAAIAFTIAVLLVELALPLYNSLVEKKLFLDFTSSKFWLVGIGLILLTGIVSGSYPAFYLSSFQPVKVLKGKLQTGKGGSLPRKVLVTLQFGFSIVLIVGTIVIYKQIQHVKDRQLGYDQENLITVDNTDEISKSYRVIKQELLQSGTVESVTKSNSPITAIYSNNFLDWPGKPKDQKVIFTTIASEYDYTKTMGIKILEGRDFSEDFKGDTSSIVINKAGLEIMGLKNPIGEKVDVWGGQKQIIGIVDNVLMGSPYQAVKPMMMLFQPDWTSAITIRLSKTSDLQTSIKKVEEIFKKYNSAYPFKYSFVDQDFEKKFTTINLISQLSKLFASLAIIITCLGLFGLAAFTAEQRTKEIGIRKVMGATVPSLVILISKDFSRLVLLAFLISAPIAWWLLNNFLERYPYRIEIPWWIMPAAGLVALLLEIAIVSTQAIKAATANPSQSLRNE